jgi:hypothetical protein
MCFNALSRLRADYRLCMTGTPMSRMSDLDLHGLARFLRIPQLGRDIADFRRLIPPGDCMGTARLLQVGVGRHSSPASPFPTAVWWMMMCFARARSSGG